MEKQSEKDDLREIVELMDQMPEFVKQFPNPKQYEDGPEELTNNR